MEKANPNHGRTTANLLILAILMSLSYFIVLVIKAFYRDFLLNALWFLKISGTFMAISFLIVRPFPLFWSLSAVVGCWASPRLFEFLLDDYNRYVMGRKFSRMIRRLQPAIIWCLMLPVKSARGLIRFQAAPVAGDPLRAAQQPAQQPAEQPAQPPQQPRELLRFGPFGLVRYR
ncbi:hypothetical protein DL770_002597 [Monosporascus sp. CRB-9-2]|nr:hypothetical protein DL770_002597 [Monosporascus sp. CRB-9-2]